jgi:hypothetical protein
VALARGLGNSRRLRLGLGNLLGLPELLQHTPGLDMDSQAVKPLGIERAMAVWMG